MNFFPWESSVYGVFYLRVSTLNSCVVPNLIIVFFYWNDFITISALCAGLDFWWYFPYSVHFQRVLYSFWKYRPKSSSASLTPLCSQFLRTPGKTHETHTNNRITYVYVYYTAQHYTDRHISGSAMTPRCNKLFWSLKIKILLEFYVIILWQSTFLFAYNQFWWFWYTAGFTTRADIVPYAENCFIPKSRNSVCKKTGKCFVHRWRSRFSQTRV